MAWQRPDLPICLKQPKDRKTWEKMADMTLRIRQQKSTILRYGTLMKETLWLPQLTILMEFPGFGSAKKWDGASSTPWAEETESEVWRDQQSYSLQNRVPKRKALHRERTTENFGGLLLIIQLSMVNTYVWVNCPRSGGKNAKKLEGIVPGTHTHRARDSAIPMENLLCHRILDRVNYPMCLPFSSRDS